MRPWSYSRLTTWEDCPLQYKYRYVDAAKSFRPSSPAADRGSRIHGEAENYLKGELLMYPPELQKVAGHAMLLKKKQASPEVKMAVKADWTPCDYESSDAYFRVIMDIHYVEDGILHIEDWKTGQVYEKEHKDQLECYVPVAAAHLEDFSQAHTRLIYIDQGFVTNPRVVDKDRIKPIKLFLDGRIANAEADTEFVKKPGQHCRWCGYSKKYGGPCEN